MRPIRTSLEKCVAVRVNHPLDDRMRIKCTISGKHICSLEEDDDGLQQTTSNPEAQGSSGGTLEVPQGVIRSSSRDSTSSEEDLSGGRKNWIYEYMVDEKKKKKYKAHEELEQQFGGGLHEHTLDYGRKDVENVDPEVDDENWKYVKRYHFQ